MSIPVNFIFDSSFHSIYLNFVGLRLKLMVPDVVEVHERLYDSFDQTKLQLFFSYVLGFKLG